MLRNPALVVTHFDALSMFQEKNKVSLRNLSVVLRKEVTKTKDEAVDNVNEGLKCAQEALALDPDDGTSWYIMGNAFIASFFTIKQSSKVLAQAMDAYERAVSR